jgi:hypothetical protein
MGKHVRDQTHDVPGVVDAPVVGTLQRQTDSAQGTGHAMVFSLWFSHFSDPAHGQPSGANPGSQGILEHRHAACSKTAQVSVPNANSAYHAWLNISRRTVRDKQSGKVVILSNNHVLAKPDRA